MACDCAEQSYSYDSTVRGQPVYPTGLSDPLSPSRLCRARHFWSRAHSFFLVPFAEGRIRCGGFLTLNLPSENRLSAFSHAVVFVEEGDF